MRFAAGYGADENDRNSSAIRDPLAERIPVTAHSLFIELLVAWSLGLAQILETRPQS